MANFIVLGAEIRFLLEMIMIRGALSSVRRQLQKDLENLDQEKLLMETRLREQHELCEKFKRLEQDNQRYRQLGYLLHGRRRRALGVAE